MAKDMDTKSAVIPLLPLNPTMSKDDEIKQRRAEPWDIANTVEDIDKIRGYGHLVVVHPVSSYDAETLVGESRVIMPTDEEKQLGVFRKLTRTLWKWGIETHGCVLHAFKFAYLTF